MIFVSVLPRKPLIEQIISIFFDFTRQLRSLANIFLSAITTYSSDFSHTYCTTYSEFNFNYEHHLFLFRFFHSSALRFCQLQCAKSTGWRESELAVTNIGVRKHQIVHAIFHSLWASKTLIFLITQSDSRFF